jgi:hypothetical protein
VPSQTTETTYENVGFCGASSCSRRTGCFGTRWLNLSVNKTISQSVWFRRGNSIAKTLKINGLCDLQQPKVMADTWANLHKSVSLTPFSHTCGRPDCMLWHNAGCACTNVLHVLAEGLGVAILRPCTNNGNNILSGGVCGWMVYSLTTEWPDLRCWRPFWLSLREGLIFAL